MAKKTINRHRRLASFGLYWLITFLVLESFLFSEVLKNHNYVEIFPQELIFPTFMHALTALIIAAVVNFVRKPSNIGVKLVLATILSLFMVSYADRLAAVTGLFRAIIPILPQPDSDLPIISLLLLLILGLATIWFARWVESLQKKHEYLQTSNLVVGISIIVGFMFFGQALRIGQILPTMVRQSTTTAPLLTKPENQDQAANQNKPDIFYIVLDRYTNSNVLNEQFEFDNSYFIESLRDNGFHVNDDAYANYPYTTISMASTLSADYTNKLVAPYKDDQSQSKTLYHNLIRQSNVIKALKAGGYQYYNIGTNYGATNKAPLANRDFMYERVLTLGGGKELKRLRGLEDSQFVKSPYYAFAKLGLSPIKVSDGKDPGADYAREQLAILNNLATQKSSGGRFIFSHMLVPHDPFTLNSDCTINPYAGTDNQGLPLKQKYTNQVACINAQMQQLVANIQKQSQGKAVIILNADEGAYPQFMESTFLKPVTAEAVFDEGDIKGDMADWSADWLKMKFGILQAAHIPKATDEDLANLSSVNVFRIVLNRYLGYQLDYLPECHFGLNLGTQSMFNYADVSEKLHSKAAPQCKQFESLRS